MELYACILYSPHLIGLVFNSNDCLRVFNQVYSCNQLIFIPFENNNPLMHNLPIFAYAINVSCKY